MFRRIHESILAAAALTLAGTLASAQVPDVIVWDIGVDGPDANDIHYWGQANGIAAYSIATQSCNEGNAQLDWFDAGGDTRHPVISQNLFRLKDGRFEHVGQSWLKHGFCAVNEFETGCGPCQSTSCDTLGIGCADTYWATLNDGAGGRSKRFVNATTGQHTDGTPGPVGLTTIRGRLQVAVSDIDPAQNPGAEYFIEGHYITADDAAANRGRNNATWRRVNVVGVGNINGGGPSQRRDPAIFAWKDQDPSVEIHEVTNDEGGITTYYFVASKVTSVGPNMWSYEYAVQNLNSDQSAGSFRVPYGAGTTVSSLGFHDVDYHSGDPYSGTDWSSLDTGGTILWETQSFGANANANAIRWATLYNFRFLADAPPTTGVATLGLFKPGANASLSVTDLQVPGEPLAMCATPASVVGRNGGSNPMIFTASAPSPGGSANFGLFALYNFGVVFGYSAPDTIVLGNGQALLVDPNSNPMFSIALTGLPLGQGSIDVPNDVAFCGMSSYTQAILFGPTGGGPLWQLTNAQDITVGF